MVALLAAVVASRAIKVADQWERAVVCAGRFRALKGPGLFGIIPIIDTVPVLGGYPRDHQRLSRRKKL